MSEPLTGGQADDAREIARQEVRGFARLLADEIARTTETPLVLAGWTRPATAMHRVLDQALQRFERGEVA